MRVGQDGVWGRAWGEGIEEEGERESQPVSTPSVESHTGLISGPCNHDLSQNQESVVQPTAPPRAPPPNCFFFFLNVHLDFIL